MEAALYQTHNKTVYCHLCAHCCVIGPGKTGRCGVRMNQNGILETLVYGRLVAQSVDPIEKKPLFHFFPGSRTYSIATVGCNFKCHFCQNTDIAHMPQSQNGRLIGETVLPKQVVSAAEKTNCQSIAYTYTEPTVFFEYTLDTARLAHQRQIKNIYVSNGYMSAKALSIIAPYLDAANVDLKAFSNTFYKEYCGAALTPVLNTLRKIKQLGIWLEITTLIIPGLNDSPQELEKMAGFIASELGPETPWHISRFHPAHQMTDRPITPLTTLIKAREIGSAAGLRYVYMGNVPGQEGENSFCHACNQIVIGRRGFQIEAYRIENGCCKYCGTPMDGIGL